MPPKPIKKPTRSPVVKQPGIGHPAHSISLSPNWERRLKELEAFKKEHGHCNVPANYSANRPLANWVAHVRNRKQSGEIASELARRLNGLGFTWVLRRRTVYRRDWDLMVAALTAFKKEHGHYCVPLQPAKYRALGMWLIEVRRRKKRGLLDHGRIQQLDRLGVMWEPNNHKWEAMFADLLAYQAKYGDCNVPAYWPENARLASWVYRQRTSRRLDFLTQDRRERLDKIGFVWARAEEAWESKYAALVEYQRVHGHCRVSAVSKDYASLSKWVRIMRVYRRRGKLDEERIRRLTQLGFVWDGASKARIAEAWESRYAALVEYQRTHGHCRVPTQSKDHASLSQWVSTMRGYRRRGKLDEERIRRLTQLGFVWDGASKAGMEEAWESKYAALVEYQRTHGNCRVPCDTSLGRWVSKMRKYRRWGKLSEERIRRLDELSFTWDGRQGRETTQRTATQKAVTQRPVEHPRNLVDVVKVWKQLKNKR